MTVRLRYSCLNFQIASILFNSTMKKLMKQEKYEKAFTEGKWHLEWDMNDTKVFYLVIEDPELEADAKKEWKGENRKKRFAMRMAKLATPSRGFTLKLVEE